MKRDWHIIVAVLALIATLVGVAVQIRQGAGLFGAEKAKTVSTGAPTPPPIISKTGIVIEQKAGAATGGEGSQLSSVLLVTVPPDTGKWRQLLCRNDEIVSIDGNVSPTLRDAQETLYNDGGDKIVVRQFGDGRMIAVDSTGLARCSI